MPIPSARRNVRESVVESLDRGLNNMHNQCTRARASLTTQRLELAGAYRQAKSFLSLVSDLQADGYNANNIAGPWNAEIGVDWDSVVKPDFIPLVTTDLPAFIAAVDAVESEVISGQFDAQGVLKLDGALSTPTRVALEAALDAVLARFTA